MSVARFALGALLAVGCAAQPAGPPEVRWGVDECSDCHMIVGEPRFAAVGRGPSGEEVRFDDLACLMRWHAEGHAAWRYWVHDAAGDGWLDAELATYLHVPGRATPMGSGLTAYAAADAAAAANGPGVSGEEDVLSWAEAQRHATAPTALE